MRGSNRPFIAVPSCTRVPQRPIHAEACNAGEGVHRSFTPETNTPNRAELRQQTHPEAPCQGGLIAWCKGMAISIGGAAILMSPDAAWADLVQTVPASQVMEMAKPLTKQSIDKGKVWTVFIGGAIFLFLGTLAVENNPSFFPAISKANKAAAVAKEAAEAAEKQARAMAVEASEVQRQSSIVEQGLAEAKQRVLSQPPPPLPQVASAQRPASALPSIEAEPRAAALDAPHPTEAVDDDKEAQEKRARLSSFVNGMAPEGQPALGSLRSQMQGKDTVNTL